MSHVEEEDCEPPREDQEPYGQEFKTEDDEVETESRDLEDPFAIIKDELDDDDHQEVTNYDLDNYEGTAG